MTLVYPFACIQKQLMNTALKPAISLCWLLIDKTSHLLLPIQLPVISPMVVLLQVILHHFLGSLAPNIRSFLSHFAPYLSVSPLL